jgi:hypothetical protein
LNALLYSSPFEKSNSVLFVCDVLEEKNQKDERFFRELINSIKPECVEEMRSIFKQASAV